MPRAALMSALGGLCWSYAACGPPRPCNPKREIDIEQVSGGIHLEDGPASEPPLLHVDVSRGADTRLNVKALDEMSMESGQTTWGLPFGDGRTVAEGRRAWDVVAPRSCTPGYDADLTFSVELPASWGAAVSVEPYVPTTLTFLAEEWWDTVLPDVCPWDGWCIDLILDQRGSS